MLLRWIGVSELRKSSRAELLSTSAPISANQAKSDDVGSNRSDHETKSQMYLMQDMAGMNNNEVSRSRSAMKETGHSHHIASP